MRRSFGNTSGWILAALALAACGGGDGGTASPPPPPPSPLVIEKAPSSGDLQTGIAGQALASPVRVKLTRGGAAAAGEAVTWTTSAGAIVGSGPSGADGIATATWTLGGTAGNQTATATSGTVSTQFSATATAPMPGVLAISAFAPTGDAQTAAIGSLLPIPLKVRVTRGGVPAPGELVIWQADSPNAFFDPVQTTTAFDGTAQGFWTLGTTVGAQGATAFAGSLTGPSTVFTATGTALAGGNTVRLYTSSGARFEPASLVVPVGTTVTFLWSDGFHDITPTGTPTFAGVLAATDPPKQYQVTFTTAGTYRYYCTIHGTPTSGMRGMVIVQ